jgi:hypothetical protein
MKILAALGILVGCIFGMVFCMQQLMYMLFKPELCHYYHGIFLYCSGA